MRTKTILIPMIIALIAGPAAAKGRRQAVRSAAFVGQRTLRVVSGRAGLASRNSVLGDFRQRLPRSQQQVWDRLKPGQKIGVLHDFAAGGQVKWTDYLTALDEAGKAGPFDARNLASQPQNYTVLGKDQGHPRSKFTVIRDLMPRMVIDQGKVPVDADGEPLFTKAELADPRTIDHAVSVATPNGKQPIWLHQVDSKGAGHLGRMVRDALGALPRTHGTSWGTKAYINMPGVITIPRLHAHGVWRGNQAKVSDWDRFVQSNNYTKLGGQQGADYQLYQAPRRVRGDAKRLPIVAVADKRYGGTGAISGKTDAVLGQMILDVAQVALKSGNPGALERGRIEIDSTDKRLVVRLYERPAQQMSE